MFNDYLANESAKLHLAQRMQEAETYRLHQRIGADDSKAMWRASLALMVLIGLALVVAFA